MHKLLRYYSQNRIRIWLTILSIIFILLIIRVLNDSVVTKTNNNITKEETTNNVVSYANQSNAIITGETVPERYQNNFGTILDTFFTYCINHEPEKAYQMLSADTKTVLYQSETMFEKLYYQEKFLGDKQYSFQAWAGTGNTYIYQVKIFDNMLSTGKVNNEYIEDYVTVTWEDGDYQLNINSYIGRTDVNKKSSNDLLTVEVSYVDVYMDYQIFTLHVKNNKDEEVILDTRRQNKTTYVTDNNDNKFEAVLYELSDDDLKVDAKESKTIEVKFNVSFRSNIAITSVNFSDCVITSKYNQDGKIKGEILEIEAE